MKTNVTEGLDPQGVSGTTLLQIKHFVEQFRVCWETYEEHTVVKDKIRETGFELDLFGTHEPGTEHISPGCANCKQVQLGLRQIADWILPHEERPSIYEVSMDEQSLTYSNHRRNRPDVQLTIRILHRRDFEKPIDDCEKRCLQEMKTRLAEIGACRHSWMNHGSSQVLR
jgi:hypothetical protein